MFSGRFVGQSSECTDGHAFPSCGPRFIFHLSSLRLFPASVSLSLSQPELWWNTWHHIYNVISHVSARPFPLPSLSSHFLPRTHLESIRGNQRVSSALLQAFKTQNYGRFPADSHSANERASMTRLSRLISLLSLATVQQIEFLMSENLRTDVQEEEVWAITREINTPRRIRFPVST